MSSLRHKKDTKQFVELTFTEQAKSINATIVNLQRAINVHVNNSNNPAETRIKCIQQLMRLTLRL